MCQGGSEFLSVIGLVCLFCCSSFCILESLPFLVFPRWIGKRSAMVSTRCLLVICVGGKSGGSAVVFPRKGILVRL